jgi:hypothetical protein
LTIPEDTLVAAGILVLSAALPPKVTVAHAPMVNGQVTKIDESAGKSPLSTIKKLDMNEGDDDGLSRSGSGYAQASESRRKGPVRR